jgi:hypothetical protein
MTVFCYRDNFNITTCANPDGWGNKLVTFFARHRDNFIVTLRFQSSENPFFPALDKSVYRDNFIVRRDWQKMRHGGLPAGTNPT